MVSSVVSGVRYNYCRATSKIKEIQKYAKHRSMKNLEKGMNDIQLAFSFHFVESDEILKKVKMSNPN